MVNFTVQVAIIVIIMKTNYLIAGLV